MWLLKEGTGADSVRRAARLKSLLGWTPESPESDAPAEVYAAPGCTPECGGGLVDYAFRAGQALSPPYHDAPTPGPGGGCSSCRASLQNEQAFVRRSVRSARHELVIAKQKYEQAIEKFGSEVYPAFTRAHAQHNATDLCVERLTQEGQEVVKCLGQLQLVTISHAWLEAAIAQVRVTSTLEGALGAIVTKYHPRQVSGYNGDLEWGAW